jgi:hypothetical protein
VVAVCRLLAWYTIPDSSAVTRISEAINLGDDAKHVVRTITARLENEATKDLPERVLMPAVAGR